MMSPIRSLLANSGRTLWVVAGILSVMVGLLGAVLPVLPTTPFVILGAFCFTRGSPRLAQKLEQHRLFGPIITDWRAHQAIAPRYKVIAHLMMGAALILSVLTDVSGTILSVQAICMVCASAYILSRPNGHNLPKSKPRRTNRCAEASQDQEPHAR